MLQMALLFIEMSQTISLLYKSNKWDLIWMLLILMSQSLKAVKIISALIKKSTGMPGVLIFQMELFLVTFSKALEVF